MPTALFFQADYVQYYEFDPPSLCPNPAGCSNNIFNDKEQFQQAFCTDYQVRLGLSDSFS